MNPHASHILDRFVAINHELNADRGWWGDSTSLRFAAMAAVTCPGEPAHVASSIRSVADEIKERSGWFGELRSQLRFIVSAMLTLNEDSAVEFLGEVERVREFFRSVKLRRGGIYEMMAILVLRQQARKEPIPMESVHRFQALYEEMKRHHWWLTGPDDFPACAILVGQEGTPEEIGERVEEIYKALLAEGFSGGDPLQTAANILYLAGVDPETVAHRYQSLSGGFKQAGVSVWQSDYDELAILSFLDHPPEDIVDRVLECRKEMEALKPKPDRSMTFNLAASIAFLELVCAGEDLQVVADAKVLMDMQAVINAQQASAAAATSAAAR